jgi:hypothetical protein
VTIDFEVMVNLSQSPTTALSTVAVSTRSCPNNINCSLQITSRWTRTSAALRARAGTRAVLRAVFASP